MIIENPLKRIWKNVTGDGTKKIKRLTKMQVFIKDFISCKSRYKSLRKKKVTVS